MQIIIVGTLIEVLLINVGLENERAKTINKVLFHIL